MDSHQNAIRMLISPPYLINSHPFATIILSKTFKMTKFYFRTDCFSALAGVRWNLYNQGDLYVSEFESLKGFVLLTLHMDEFT